MELSKSILSAIENYVYGAAEQDVERVSSAFHEDFRLVVTVGLKTMHLDKKTYLDMMAAKKVGGNERKMNVVSLTEFGRIATARVVLEEAKQTFEDNLSLIKDGDVWKIIFNLTEMKPHEGK